MLGIVNSLEEIDRQIDALREAHQTMPTARLHQIGKGEREARTEEESKVENKQDCQDFAPR